MSQYVVTTTHASGAHPRNDTRVTDVDKIETQEEWLYLLGDGGSVRFMAPTGKVVSVKKIDEDERAGG